MTRPRTKRTNYLILLALGLSMPLLSAFYPILADISITPKTSSLISAQGKYSSFIPKGDIRRFAGETLTYDIDFLFFDKAATAKVRFFEYKGKYFSTLSAETKGVVGFFHQLSKALLQVLIRYR